MRTVTIKHVAAEADVSVATVSRVLAGTDCVGEGARSRVLKAVRKMKYHPNRMARGLRAGHANVIGLIIPDLQNPFFTGVAHGVEGVLYSRGFTLVLGHSDGLPEREDKHLAVLRGEGAAGLIFIPGNAQDADYSMLGEWQVPVVAVDRAPRGLEVDFVDTDNRNAARKAVEHLLAHGHRLIGMINGPEGFTVTRERLAGYREALAAAGVESARGYVLHSDFRQAGGEAAMRQLLALTSPPRAVLVANNLMTLGALEAIHDRGTHIPDDIAVVCFDDMPWATSLNPPLTAVAQPAEEMGRTAAELLLERLKDPQRLPRRVTLPNRLVVRASCGQHEPGSSVAFSRTTWHAERAIAQPGVSAAQQAQTSNYDS